ncbi:MAG: flagellar M-ring protein FliF [Syntrophorhabdaceae bacterium]|nr:flagellar M-ring protein FliF [Syntrophorhabdaceae bacterium]
MANVTNIKELVEAIKEWPMHKKVFALSAILISVALLVLMFAWSQKEEYQVLFTNLTESDSGQIAVQLKEMKIPYRAEARGILVPESKVYEARLQLASQGLPQGGGVGFELFDKSSFGATEFVQKLNYKRALQGELARTIMAMGPVEHCRVHLAIPEKSLFVREGEDRPTSSVLLRLRSGKMLTVNQVEGIVHLVASSVEGLEPKDVTVVDTRGNVLSKQTSEYGELTSAGLSAKQFEFQSRYARELEARIVYLLEAAVGKGKVRARVSAEVDMSQVETTEEKFDPESQVARSEQKQAEKSSSVGPSGIPGVTSNLPDRRFDPITPAHGSSEKSNQIVNYEISKVVSRTVGTPGVIKKVTAAVIVDGAYVAKQGSKEMAYMPRKEEELKWYEGLVKEAIGFSEGRGDQVKVVNVPFEPDSDEFAPTFMSYVSAAASSMASLIIPVLIIILLFLFVLRPIVQSLFGKKPEEVEAETETEPEPAAQEEAVPPAGEIFAEIEEEGPEAPKEMTMREKVAEWALNNPREAANIIKGWMGNG